MISRSDRMPVGGNRLDPMLIQDPLVRARLYADIRNRSPYRNATYWTEYTVSPGERFMPELIAVRAWNDETLKWVVLLVAEVDDPRRELESGLTLRLPTREWLRDRIKYYEALEAVPVPTGELQRIGKPKNVRLPDKPPEAPTPADIFKQQVNGAINILQEPVPVLRPQDSLTEVELNKQGKAIDGRMQAVAQALDSWRQVDGGAVRGFENELLTAGMAMAQPLPVVRKADPMDGKTLNKQADAVAQRMQAMANFLAAWQQVVGNDPAMKTDLLNAMAAMAGQIPEVNTTDPLNDETLNKQAIAAAGQLANIAPVLGRLRNE